MARYRTAIRACCDHKSREYTLRLCGVTFRDTLCAPRASFSRTYHHNQRVVCLRLCRQRVKHQPKEKLVLEQRSVATDFRCKGYRVSTCSFQQTFVLVLTIAVHSSYIVESHKHQARSSRTPPRDIDVPWCLVEDTACTQSSFVSSVCTCLAERQSPDPSLPAAMGCEQSVCWRPPGEPQRCSTK